MTYQMMESTLMERIADLRNSEADFARSLNSVRNGETNVDLNAQYLRMNAQLSEVEKLLARMDAFELEDVAAFANVPATAPSALMAA